MPQSQLLVFPFPVPAQSGYAHRDMKPLRADMIPALSTDDAKQAWGDPQNPTITDRGADRPSADDARDSSDVRTAPGRSCRSRVRKEATLTLAEAPVPLPPPSSSASPVPVAMAFACAAGRDDSSSSSSAPCPRCTWLSSSRRTRPASPSGNSRTVTGASASVAALAAPSRLGDAVCSRGPCRVSGVRAGDADGVHGLPSPLLPSPLLPSPLLPSPLLSSPSLPSGLPTGGRSVAGEPGGSGGEPPLLPAGGGDASSVPYAMLPVAAVGSAPCGAAASPALAAASPVVPSPVVPSPGDGRNVDSPPRTTAGMSGTAHCLRTARCSSLRSVAVA